MKKVGDMKREIIANRRTKKRKTFDDIIKPMNTIQDELYALAEQRSGQLVRLADEKKKIEKTMVDAEAEKSKTMITINNIIKFFTEKIVTEPATPPDDADIEDTLMLKPKPIESDEKPIDLTDSINPKD